MRCDSGKPGGLHLLETWVGKKGQKIRQKEDGRKDLTSLKEFPTSEIVMMFEPSLLQKDSTRNVRALLLCVYLIPSVLVWKRFGCE